jgi:hypothetical protein
MFLRREGMRIWKNHYRILALILVLACAASLAAQTPKAKKVLTLEDYPRWKHIVSAAVAPDWMVDGVSFLKKKK